jgi:subtilase family serine protease
MRKLCIGWRAAVLGLAAISAIGALAWTTAAGADSTDWTYVANPPRAQVDVTGSGMAQGGVPYCTSRSLGSLVCYAPSFIRTAYNVPSSLDGSGQTILIVDAFGSPTIQNDLAVFDSTFGLSAPPSFRVFCPQGCPALNGTNPPHDQQGWAIETTLDVEWAHAVAPGANIVLVVASTSSGNAINNAEAAAIARFPGSVMSQSFGINETAIIAGANNAQLKQAHANYVAAQQAGITALASAGDEGATNGGNVVNALYPSSDPLDTAVGGTMGNPYVPFGQTGPCDDDGVCTSGLVTYTGTCPPAKRPAWPSSCTPLGYGDEQVWNEPFFGPIATGGAPSLLFAAPSYQQGVTGFTQRTTSDVSYDAAINGGVLVFTSFLGAPVWFVVGGTSAGSPQWAGVVALANQARGLQAKGPLGFLNATIYTLAQSSRYASDFHDITLGDNKAAGTPAGFPAGTGYDLPTGWGTPNVANLVSDLAK